MPLVLVVDDEIQIGKSLCRLLRRAGLQAEPAAGGSEALEKLESLRPDLIISDYRMPGMDGLELLAEIERRAPRTARVLLSGHADMDAVSAAVNTGRIARFLPKPWADDGLLKLVQDLLGPSFAPEGLS